MDASQLPCSFPRNSSKFGQFGTVPLCQRTVPFCPLPSRLKGVRIDPKGTVRAERRFRDCPFSAAFSANPPWALPRAWDFLARRGHAYPFEKIISYTFPLIELNEAFTMADEGKAIRVSLTS